MIGIEKKKSKNKRADALKGGWPMIGIAKRVQQWEGLCIEGRWTITGIAKKKQKYEG